MEKYTVKKLNKKNNDLEKNVAVNKSKADKSGQRLLFCL
mgnify:CR=1 FL=1